MTGRLTQDCVENLFSCIRGKGDAHPSPVHFRHNLRMVSLSQYMQIVPSSSYDVDDSTYFLDFLKNHPRKQSTLSSDEDMLFLEERVFPNHTTSSLMMNVCESNVLYLLAGWSVFKEKTKISGCADCLDAICSDSNELPFDAKLHEFKTYGGLTKPSELVHKIIVDAENVFRSCAENLELLDNVEDCLWTEFTKCCTLIKQGPLCHDALSNIVRRYFRLRIHIYGKKLTEKHSLPDNVQHGSRSAYCRTKIR